MADDVETYSHAAKMGGLRSLQIDRFVANQAAVNCVGPPTSKKALEHFVRYFHEFLKQAGTVEDRELRRRVLLMVTEGRDSVSAHEHDASTVRKLVDDVYKTIA